MLDPEGSEIIGTSMRCFAERLVPANEPDASEVHWRELGARPEARMLMRLTESNWDAARRRWHDVPCQAGHQVHPASHSRAGCTGQVGIGLALLRQPTRCCGA